MTITPRAATMASLLALSLVGAAKPNAEDEFARLPAIATVDDRFQSYNVEMVEVTGGRFWAPYGGSSDEQYRRRPPEDLADKRLRALTKHLGPSYMRVSGTWANSTYLEAEGEHLTAPPKGYNQILTRDQWRGVVDFARAVNAKIGVSYAVGEGSRTPDGTWKTDQAQRLIDLTREAGGEVAFSEFINEPNAASLGSLPKDYSVADYTRDFAIFRAWAKRAAPAMKIVGPGGVGEGGDRNAIPIASLERMLMTDKLMERNPDTVDAVSYHFYGEVSQRCAKRRPTTAQRSDALTPSWLDLTLRDWRYYSALRDKYEPGDPMWVTETAQAACGGSPWAAYYVDSFRYVNQLGLLAQKGVTAVFHNTLTASDYSLIEEGTREPRPNYWAAVLWRRTMGAKVLASPSSPSPQLRIYAHCLPKVKGGVGLAAINLGVDVQAIPLRGTAQVWQLEGTSIDSKSVTVNGTTPALASDGRLTGLGAASAFQKVLVSPKSIAFIALPGARNSECSAGA